MYFVKIGGNWKTKLVLNALLDFIDVSGFQS